MQHHRRHLRVHLEEHAQVQLDLDLGLPHAGGGRHGRHRAGVHAGRRSGVPARGYQCRHVGRCLRAASVVLLGHRHEPLHGDRQDACRTYAVGQDRQSSSTPRTPSRWRCVPTRQTSGWSLTEQDPFNNVARTAIEAMGAALGHTQSLHTNALDEAIALPTDFSARIARNTQIYIQEETNICRNGRSVGRFLLCGVAHQRDRTQGMGAHSGGREAGRYGQGYRDRYSQDAYRGGVRPASRPASTLASEKIIGLNEYRLEKEAPIDILAVDNTAVRESQIKRLKELRATRDQAAVKRRWPPSPSASRPSRATFWSWPSRPRRYAPRWARSRMPARSS